MVRQLHYSDPWITISASLGSASGKINVTGPKKIALRSRGNVPREIIKFVYLVASIIMLVLPEVSGKRTCPAVPEGTRFYFGVGQ